MQYVPFGFFIFLSSCGESSLLLFTPMLLAILTPPLLAIAWLCGTKVRLKSFEPVEELSALEHEYSLESSEMNPCSSGELLAPLLDDSANIVFFSAHDLSNNPNPAMPPSSLPCYGQCVNGVCKDPFTSDLSR